MLIDRSFAELLDQPGYDPSERRTEARVPFETDVTIGAGDRVLTGLSGDISMGGMFVATFRTMEPGTRLSLRFRLPTGQVMATGFVRWTRDARPGMVAGMGIEFVDLGDMDYAALKRFCGDRPRFLAYDEIVSSASAQH
jgi:uncharacterized protein (TIGR02266 family)